MSEQSFSIQMMGAEVRACFSEEFVAEMGRQLTPALLTYFGLKHVNKKISLIIFATFEYQDLWHAESMYLPILYIRGREEGLLWVRISVTGRILQDCKSTESVRFELCEKLDDKVQYVNNRLKPVLETIEDKVPVVDEPAGSVGQMFMYEMAHQISEELKRLLYIDYDCDQLQFVIYGNTPEQTHIFEYDHYGYTKLRAELSGGQFFEFWIRWHYIPLDSPVDIFDIINYGSTLFEICTSVPASVLLQARQSSNVDKMWIPKAREMFLANGCRAAEAF